MLSTFAFAFGRFTLAGRLVFGGRFALLLALLLTLPFAFSLAFFGFGFRGLFSFALAAALLLRFSFGSSAGVTVSGVSPSLAGRLMSIATV